MCWLLAPSEFSKRTGEEPTMAQDQKIIQTKVGLLELAKQLGNAHS
jgi:hypothetical protein